MTYASPPPFAKKWRTEYERLLSWLSPPNARSKSAKLNSRVGRPSIPVLVGPTNRATDVGAPVIVRTPLGISRV
jgi:hypothetical protein